MQKIDKSRIAYTMGKKYKVTPYLEKAIKGFEDEWQYSFKEKEKDHHWHPSSHCLMPVYELYQMATGEYFETVEHAPISGGLRKAFQVGHFWHQWLQYIILNKLDGFATEEDVERSECYSWGEGPYHAVCGSADVCPIKTPRWEGAIDFKTMNNRDFLLAEQKGALSEWNAAKYECQMNMYMYLFKQEEWLIIAIQKEHPHNFAELLFPKNDDLVAAILDKWKYVSEALDSGEPVTILESDEWPALPTLTGPIAS